MNCTIPQHANPIEQFIGCFDSVGDAATAADVSYEMLRRMRARGYVTTRDRAITMAAACGHRIKPAALMAFPAKPH